MYKSSKGFAAFVAVLVLLRADAGARPKEGKIQQEVAEITGQGRPVLWRDPVDIATRNLLYGSGGRQHLPRGPFTFLKEDRQGSNPKFDVRAADGVKWKVKLGIEARPEVAASRLVWAVGYNVMDQYFMPELPVQGMPARLHRGRKYVALDGTAFAVRLKRDPEDGKKIGNWSWTENPFLGTREFNGLRALMAVINNWDLKEVNNAVYQVQDHGNPRQLYLISDLGASFGTTGFGWTRTESRGNLKAYRRSKFIRQITPGYVDFATPSFPALDHAPAVRNFIERIHMRSIGRQVPRQDARWMGQMLGRLSPRQIRDAFRAAGYDPEKVEAFSQVVEARIAELKNL